MNAIQAATPLDGFRLFIDVDYWAFAGVESPAPQIASIESSLTECIITIVLDGSTVSMMVFFDLDDSDTEAIRAFDSDEEAATAAEAIRKLLLDSYTPDQIISLFNLTLI